MDKMKELEARINYYSNKEHEMFLFANEAYLSGDKENEAKYDSSQAKFGCYKSGMIMAAQIMGYKVDDAVADYGYRIYKLTEER